MSTVSSVIPPSQTLYLGSHVHSDQCEPTSQTLYMGHMSQHLE